MKQSCQETSFSLLISLLAKLFAFLLGKPGSLLLYGLEDHPYEVVNAHDHATGLLFLEKFALRFVQIEVYTKRLYQTLDIFGIVHTELIGAAFFTDFE